MRCPKTVMNPRIARTLCRRRIIPKLTPYPLPCEVEVLKTCFDFDAIKAFVSRPDFSLCYDSMHGQSRTQSQTPALSVYLIDLIRFLL